MIAGNNNIEPINVFLIGNNPIELSNIYEKLKEIRSKTYQTEIGFELRGLFKKIMKFNPACILIDDNVERSYMKKLTLKLASNKHTRDIPITILKNANRDSYITNAEEFVLKESVTAELLSRSIVNSIRLKKMRTRISLMYRKRKSQVKSWLS
ncbi:MAG: hypothetical protein ABJH05_13395 [Fulvivirga sp.]